jgi:hypothetical protein
MQTSFSEKAGIADVCILNFATCPVRVYLEKLGCSNDAKRKSEAVTLGPFQVATVSLQTSEGANPLDKRHSASFAWSYGTKLLNSHIEIK